MYEFFLDIYLRWFPGGSLKFVSVSMTGCSSCRSPHSFIQHPDWHWVRSGIRRMASHCLIRTWPVRTKYIGFHALSMCDFFYSDIWNNLSPVFYCPVIFPLFPATIWLSLASLRHVMFSWTWESYSQKQLSLAEAEPYDLMTLSPSASHSELRSWPLGTSFRSGIGLRSHRTTSHWLLVFLLIVFLCLLILKTFVILLVME